MNWEQLYNDFRQKYEGTYCWAILEGQQEKDLYYVELVQQTEKAPLIHLSNDKIGEIILKYDAASELDFEFPSIGFFSYSKMALLCRKTYAKQWKKGAGSSTLKFINVYSHYGIIENPSVDYRTLQAAFVIPNLLPITQGIELLKSTQALSVPLSLDFALGLSVMEEDKKYILWYLENPIGFVNEVSQEIYCKEPQFNQELLDFICQTGDTQNYALNR